MKCPDFKRETHVCTCARVHRPTLEYSSSLDRWGHSAPGRSRGSISCGWRLEEGFREKVMLKLGLGEGQRGNRHWRLRGGGREGGGRGTRPASGEGPSQIKPWVEVKKEAARHRGEGGR